MDIIEKRGMYVLKPAPNGIPASIGTTNDTFDLADQPSQNKDMTNNGPPRVASGTRRNSSFLDHAVLL